MVNVTIGTPTPADVTDTASRASVIKAWVSLIARLILGGALLYAGALKIGDLQQSVIAVQAYQLPLPSGLVTLLGYSLPIIEILLGVIIVAGLLTRWSGLAGGLFMVVFIAGIISVWVRGLAIDCGCFTPGGMLTDNQKTAYLQTILRDIGLLACAVWVVLFPASRWALDDWLRTSPDKET